MRLTMKRRWGDFEHGRFRHMRNKRHKNPLTQTIEISGTSLPNSKDSRQLFCLIAFIPQVFPKQSENIFNDSQPVPLISKPLSSKRSGKFSAVVAGGNAIFSQFFLGDLSWHLPSTPMLIR
jgi:hypothetical protein